MTVQQESSESRNPGRRYQEYTRNALGIYQECTRNAPECTRNPGRKVPEMYQESTRNPGMGPELPGILQEYVGQWKVLGKWVSFQTSRHDEQLIVVHKFVELVLVVRSKSVKILLINLVELSPLSYTFSFCM